MPRRAGLTHGFSKEIQSPVETSYRFGEFELNPSDRLLNRAGIPIRLQAKAFDALLYLVSKSQHLVTKQELSATLWPSIHVSEANLTNIIVSLRKIVGRDAISTVSKHGYRLELPVFGEPGIARATYERFARARELISQRSLQSMQLARDLFWICIAENPCFAPAWAGLGRCCWFIEKFAGASPANVDLAQAAFQRAFAIDPDLAGTHQFFTMVQVDTGHADQAMDRLLGRLQHHHAEPESFVSLVHVLRFRGLLQQSLQAHKHATQLDPAILTSVAHTLFLLGDFARSIETYGGRAAYYLDAAAWAAMGDGKRAILLLGERLAGMALSPLMTALLRSLLALLEEHEEQAVALMDAANTTREPEILFYFARHYAHIGETDRAMRALQQAQKSGFLCAPETLTSDPWFNTLRKMTGFKSLLRNAKVQVDSAKSAFEKHTAASKIWQ